MLRRRLGIIAARLAVIAAGSLALSGCGGYMLTYDEAFPPHRVSFPRFDPPESLAFAMPAPPRVETVIMDAELYFLLNPPERRIILAPTPREHARSEATADTIALASADSLARADSVAVADSLRTQARADSLAEAAFRQEVQGVRVDLSSRLQAAYISRADRDLSAARRLASLLRKLKLNREETAQLQAVEGFIKRAEKALGDDDFEGASNLAFKARTLAESLVDARP